MVFFVAVPVIFGFLANFFIPYHIGSKDVAFPRLNSIGFWIQPAGFFLLAKTSFLRPQLFKGNDNLLNYDNYLKFFYKINLFENNKHMYIESTHTTTFLKKKNKFIFKK